MRDILTTKRWAGTLGSMDSTRTTFHLSESLHRRLKSLAGRRGTTLSRLLSEGAELVLARHEGAADREELARRAEEAGARLRGGLYDGPPVSREADALVYPGAARGRRRTGR